MIDCVSPLRIRCKAGVEGGREDISERLNSTPRFLYRFEQQRGLQHQNYDNGEYRQQICWFVGKIGGDAHPWRPGTPVTKGDPLTKGDLARYEPTRFTAQTFPQKRESACPRVV